MKRYPYFSVLTMTGVLFLMIWSIMTGCSAADRELKQDAEKIAGIMCRSIEVMNKLKAADPTDSVLVRNLQAEEQKIQTEMDVQYQEFRKRHAKELNDPEFNKKFSNLLRKAMLDCKYLSEEDRENFEREIEN